MTIQSGRIRKKSKGFAQIANTVLRDKNLSLKAKGLYSLIESYLTIADWVLYKNYLMKQCKEKETSFDGAWKELKKAGYLVQYKLKDKETGKWIYEYELLDEPTIQQEQEPTPQPQKPHPENPGVENPGVENGGYISNTDFNNTNSNNTERQKREGKPSFPVLPDIEEVNIIPLEDKKESNIKPAIIPDECKNELDKYFIGRFKKERKFYGLNFNITEYYMAFADALVKTQLQDGVEVLTMAQYPYFIATLNKMIEPLLLERKLLGWD